VRAAGENIDAGGLISYGPSIPDLFRRALARLKDHLANAARAAMEANTGNNNPYGDRGG
jgi:hypothetical protein